MSNLGLQMTYLLTALQEIDRSDRSVGKTTGEDTSQTAVRVVLGAVQFKLLGSGHLKSSQSRSLSTATNASIYAKITKLARRYNVNALDVLCKRIYLRRTGLFSS